MNKHIFYNNEEDVHSMMYNNFDYCNILEKRIIRAFNYSNFNIGLSGIVHDTIPHLYVYIHSIYDKRISYILIPSIKIKNINDVEKLINNISVLLSYLSITLTLFIKNDLTWTHDKHIIQLDKRIYPELITFTII